MECLSWRSNFGLRRSQQIKVGMVFVAGSVNFLGVETFTPHEKKPGNSLVENLEYLESYEWVKTSPTKYIGVQMVLLY